MNLSKFNKKIEKEQKKFLKRRQKNIDFISIYLADASKKILKEWDIASIKYLKEIHVFYPEYKKTRRYINKKILPNLSKKNRLKLILTFTEIQDNY